jgi:His-Xaa-Ser system protein HxsD
MQDVEERPRDVVLPFESAIASPDSLQRAALKFSGLCSFSFDTTAVGTTVTLSFPFAHQVAVDELIGRYRNEVLDQVLRERIARETADERNLILAYAFSNTKLIGQ